MKLFRIRRTLYKLQFKYIFVGIVTVFLIYTYWEDLQDIWTRITIEKHCRFWYFKGGLIYPAWFNPDLKLWPQEMNSHRIIDQLMFIPKNKSRVKKKIYFPKKKAFQFKLGSKSFNSLNCPVKDCEIVSNEEDADAVVFLDNVTKARCYSTVNQTWILYMLETPYYVGKVLNQDSVNWTASYRTDSDLVTPYGLWMYYTEHNGSAALEKDYSKGKTKKVAWFVSNCRSKNKRMDYALSLSKYIEVDIYGKCGKKICDKNSPKCRQKLSKEYKFYLSFENANCRDYITEKFFVNGLQSDVIPIVMGPPKQDYEKMAPENSFIHVEDFQSPQHLAEYLHYLDNHNDSYNEYFRWKNSGEFINTYFLCRLCAMLHSNRPPHHYQDFNVWWRPPRICTRTFWKKKVGKSILDNI